MKKVLRKIETLSAQPATTPHRSYYFHGAIATAVVAIAFVAFASGAAHSSATGVTATPVDVVSTASDIPVRDINNMAYKPFSITLSPSVKSAGSFVVPAGERLVLTAMSAFDNGASIENYRFLMLSNNQGSSFVVPVTVHGATFEYAQSPLNLEADAGTTVFVSVFDNNQNDQAVTSLFLRGYFVADSAPSTGTLN